MSSRREWLQLSSASTLLLAIRPLSALAPTSEFDAALDTIRRDRPLNEGRVNLKLPALAENGNSVGLTLSIDAPADTPVRQLWILSPRNPEAQMAHFSFGPLADTSAIETRIRLSGTQKILAVAELADQSLWSAGAEVIVSVSACIDGLL